MAYNVGDHIKCDLAFAPIEPSQQAGIPDGYIAGIASTPSTDRAGHKVLAKAFDHSIKQKGLSGTSGVQLLAGHDWNKVAGKIKRLETVNDSLMLEAQLYLDVSYVKDLHTVLRQNGGLNFSVGFSLEEFEFDEEAKAADPWLIVKKADLMEVSIVTFPCQAEARMTFVKQAATPSEFEKALIANGWALSRKEAKRLHLLCRNSIHLFQDKGPPSAELSSSPNHPVLDARQLSPSLDLMRKAQAILGSR